jgi:hypothetical protein
MLLITTKFIIVPGKDNNDRMGRPIYQADGW